MPVGIVVGTLLRRGRRRHPNGDAVRLRRDSAELLHPSTALTTGVGLTEAPPSGMDLEVKVRGGGVAGHADLADDLSGLHGRADRQAGRERAEVGVEEVRAVALVNRQPFPDSEPGASRYRLVSVPALTA